MAVFLWKGTNTYGEKQKGEIEALNRMSALSHIKKLRISNPIIKEKPKDLFANISFLSPKVKGKDLVLFTRQLSTMLDAGLPLVQGLEILERQQDNSTFKKTLLDIRSDVEAGATLADSMRKKSETFNNLFTNMIEAGETGGILDNILQRLALFLEKAMALKKKVIGALIYPAVCMFIASAVFAIMMIIVIPIFANIFKDSGQPLPLPTMVVINMSNIVKDNIILIVALLILIFFIAKKAYKTEKGKLFFDKTVLKLPIFGILFRKVAVAKFTRTLSTMIQSGVPILESLQVVAKTSGNVIIERAINRASDAIAEGRPLADPLTESGVFPTMVTQMINVGESSGTLDVMLAKIADFYDEEVDQAVDNLKTMIEPLLIVFLGVVIGGIVITMYLPIFQLGSVI